jgi:hypothetical protein
MTSPLQEVADGIWVAPAPLRFLGLLELGTRMTVLKVGSDVVVHSPVPLDPGLKSAVDAIGRVRFIVAPSLFHHLHAGTAGAAWPDAKLLAPAALRKKRPDLRIDAELEAGCPEEWAGELDALPIRGTLLGETVLHHRRSRTLVAADLFENFSHVDHGLTRAYLKLNGIYGKPGWALLLRPAYRDRKAARQSVEAVLDLPIEQIVIAHGDLVTTRPRETIREALHFLF